MIFNLYVCVLFSASAATLINIKNARKHFEKLERVQQDHHLSMATRWFTTYTQRFDVIDWLFKYRNRDVLVWLID